MSDDAERDDASSTRTAHDAPEAAGDGGSHAALIAGLLLPGAGQALRGDRWGALLVFSGTLFFWWTAALELVLPNRTGYPAPLQLPQALAELRSPLTIVPDLPFAILLALALHLGAAWWARRGGLLAPGTAPVSS